MGAPSKSNLRVHGFATSIDGYGAGPNQDISNPLGIRGHPCRLEARGEMVGNNDLWIAAHAKATGLTLVTNNERELRRIPGLKIQNWVD
jgi:hypothetical protein